MAGKAILVLGGGIGGVVAANKLRSFLKEDRITVIDQSPAHSFTGSYVWILNGKRSAVQVERNLSGLVKKGIEFVQGNVSSIEPAAGKIQVDDIELGYDYLVVSLGADLEPETIPGLCCTGINIYTADGLEAAYRELLKFQGGRIVIAICRKPYKCPAAPYEAALIVDDMLRRRGIRTMVEIEIVTWEPAPMPTAGPAMGEAIVSMIKPRGINCRNNATITSFDPDLNHLSLEGGEVVPYDLLFYVPPHGCAQVVRDAGLTGEGGWVPVDPGTLATKHENLFVIGDATAIKLPNGKMLPKAGVFAHKHAEIVAAEIAAHIKRSAMPEPYLGEGYCFIETGKGTAGLAKGNFYAKPDPRIEARKPSRLLHWGKIGFEKYWFWKYL